MYVLFKVRTDETEMYWTGEYNLRTGKPKVSKDLTKAMPFQSRELAYQDGANAGLLEFKVGQR